MLLHVWLGCKICVYLEGCNVCRGCLLEASASRALSCSYADLPSLFDSVRLSYLMPGVEFMTQAWPFSASQPLNHNDYHRGRDE